LKRALCTFVLGATIFVGTHARADAIEDAAKARYTEGVKLYNRKRYEEARAAFLQAIALKKRPAAIMMLAESALKSGRYLEAMKSFDEFTALQPGEMPAKLKDLVENGKKEARAHLGRLTFDVPEGAEVTVDGEKLTEVKPIDVAVGTHTIAVTHRQETKTLEVPAEAGKVTDVHPSFVPKAIIPTDTRTRPTPLAPKPATPTEPEAPSLLSPPATKWPLYTLGAIGVGGLATAAIFGGLAANARHGVEVSQQTIARNAKPGADCTKPSSFDDAAKGQNISEFQSTCNTLARQQHFANVHQSVFQTSLIIGLAGFAGAVTWFFVAPKENTTSDTPKESTLVIPWAGAGGAGVNVEGRF
jgi:hypothetical protein